MFTHLFAAMNDLLDELIQRYPHSSGTQKKQDTEQLALLKAMSEKIMDEWLNFEEKLAIFREQMQEQDAVVENNSIKGCSTEGNEISSRAAELMNQGQGYFKLFMFKQAAGVFEQLIYYSPDSNLARLFLAMSYMHMQEWYEAQRHFQLIVALTDHPKWQALGLNALGCIQAIRMNMEQAETYFLKAHDADPTFEEPLSNLHACRNRAGQLSLYFGSAQLSCL
ncbi:tetratricopeptide repeat protein [Paenibacillus abyssi]|uniref:Tetratricopeptide repeat protein n=1 Tax=Paenibacillus abyssi TaxID=1340531 RepID=A0A917FKE7_9BACL|nr:tetratricopeptide repeat protein [Paenibacillus abyssi]GGF89086.1 hypothetical protein GCM10010916_02980 [Paenibacillus abyssi]